MQEMPKTDGRLHLRIVSCRVFRNVTQEAQVQCHSTTGSYWYVAKIICMVSALGQEPLFMTSDTPREKYLIHFQISILPASKQTHWRSRHD